MSNTKSIYDVIVVGLGGMGSAVAAHAARRGLRVLGLEQFGPVHDLGSSTGKSRIIRKAYFEDPAYVPLLLRAYDLWRDLEAETGLDVMQLTGMLMVGEADSTLLVGADASARLHDLDLHHLSRKDVETRFPMVRMTVDENALFEPDAGFIRPEVAIDAHLRVAAEHGAVLHFNSHVAEWAIKTENCVTVSLADGAILHARKLVLCVGPWFVDHAASLGVQVRIQRNVQVWFSATSAAFEPNRLPAFFVDRPTFPKPMYGFPNIGDGIKAAFHGYGEITTPQDVRREVTFDEICELRRAIIDWLPGLEGRVTATKVCMYSLTPDEHFVISPHPNASNVIVAGGFSGHGYKFCSVVGEIVTDLVERGESRHDIGFLSALRFAIAN